MAPAPALPPITYSESENARMDTDMDGLGEPLLKWYRRRPQKPLVKEFAIYDRHPASLKMLVWTADLGTPADGLKSHS